MKKIGITGQGGNFLALTLAKITKGLSVPTHIEDISSDKALLKLVSPADAETLSDTEFKNIFVCNGTHDNPDDEVVFIYLGLAPDVAVPENVDHVIYATDMLPEHIRPLNSVSIRNWRATRKPSPEEPAASEETEATENETLAEPISEAKPAKKSKDKKKKKDEKDKEPVKPSDETLFLYDFTKCSFDIARILALIDIDPGPGYIYKIPVNNTDIAVRAMLEDMVTSSKLKDFSENYRNAVVAISKNILERDITPKDLKVLLVQ